ncbi:hypothetical protein [Nostoc sp.]|uniref:hypothetical protein n=1 Tax=Nostoc sp. TaxID=1180 RepID=UPI003FA5A9A3
MLNDQLSNSSDEFITRSYKSLVVIPDDLTFLRQLPVDVQLASHQVIEKINAIQPD